MPYPFNETFATAPPAGFATLSGNAGSQTYDSSDESVVLGTTNNVTGLWRILEAGVSSNFDFEADIELIADVFGQKHFGLWLTTNKPQGSYFEGWRFVSYLPYNLDVRDWNIGQSNTERPRVTSPLVNLTGVVTWRVRARVLGARWYYEVWVDGYKFFDAVYENTYGFMPELMPAIFFYGCTIKVHAVRGQAVAPLVIGAGSYDLAAGRRPLTDQLNYGARDVKVAAGRINHYQGGGGAIAGSVTIENIPGARQVRLFEKRTGLVVGETWSSATGQYAFTNVDPAREYFVVAHDHTRVYNAVVQDMLRP